MRIFLTGFMASGKTTVGRELARLLGAAFVDLDREVEERAGASVPRIFARGGEEEFRRIERRALARAAAAEGPTVVATGGGTIVDEANYRLMAAAGRIVWLDPDFEVLSARLAASAGKRPLYGDREQARRLLDRRRPAYRRADHRLAIAAGESPREVASRILGLLGDPPCDT